MANARATWIGNYMRGRAARGPGAFEANRSLMAQASAAYDRAHGGGRSRRNPSGGLDLAGIVPGASRSRTRRNPSGFSGGQMLMIAVGLYALVPSLRNSVNQIAGQIGRAGSVATAPTSSTLPNTGAY